MLKVSGEQLGSEKNNFDVQHAKRIAAVVHRLVEARYQVACVVGGGNIVRGASLAESGFKDPVIADHMGMLATVQNGIFLGEIIDEEDGITARVMSKVPVDSVVEAYSVKRGVATLQKVGRVLIVCGGTGNAGFTTDTGTVVAAHELGCSVVVKTTSVDGVYSDDPRKNPEAHRIPRMSLDDALQNTNVNVMDNAALAYARDHGLSIAITQPIPEHVAEVLEGDTTHGSLVTP
jgi:uridylate kinase